MFRIREVERNLDDLRKKNEEEIKKNLRKFEADESTISLEEAKDYVNDLFNSMMRGA